MRRGMQNNKGLDTSKNKIEIQPYCPDDISKVYSREGALSISHRVADICSPNKMNIQIRAYVDFYGGYAEHGRYVINGLDRSGLCNVKLVPIKSLIDIDPQTMSRFTWFIKNPSFSIKNSAFLTIAGPGYAQETFLPKDGRYKIIWTMVESLKSQEEIKTWLKNVDEVWCPTTVDMSRFYDPNINTRLMKLGFDSNLYHTGVRPLDIINLRNRFVFGVLGSWNKRKGVKEIVRAFCKAFKSKDNVSLLLVCKYANRPYDGIKCGEEVKKDDAKVWDLVYELNKYTEEFKDKPHIALIDIPVHENVMPHILARFDCLVGFSMGESTWLPGLQGLAMGKPVIQSLNPCCGFSDYMNEKNSFLVDKYTIVDADDELVKGTSEYYEGQKFALGNEDYLCEMMLKINRDINSSYMIHKLWNVPVTVNNRRCEDSINDVLNRLKELNIWQFEHI